ncbi:uncharacterized protein LOC132304908 [Cornus florida]|uniref:uncharacterized protein LOC132304908 n=1 Tax=Cornus florida TaxID=4283 RepID=UPI0028974440|nr:uncharacterized protein LOC132304908 [Cornus florida]
MVIECHHSTAVQAFILAMTRGTPFHTSLVVNTPKTIDEHNERADGFVRLEEEEAVNAWKTSVISTEDKTKAKIRQKQETGRDTDSQRRVRKLYSRPGGGTEPTKEHVKRNQKSNSHNTQPVRIINVIHGRPEPTEESDELLLTCLRKARMKKRIGSVNTLHQQSATTQIKFDRTDLLLVQIPHEDPLVFSLTVAECLVRRVLIDPGSSANVMPRDTFDRLKIKSAWLKSTGNPLLGFDGKRVEPISMVEVAVHAAERVLMETFVVVKIHPSYNLLMGRGWIHSVQGVPSTLHQVMRCLGLDGSKVIDIHGDQVTAKECYSITLKYAGKREITHPFGKPEIAITGTSPQAKWGGGASGLDRRTPG